MKGDFSRLRFSARKNYTSVLKQQGRVDLDADANEQCAIDEYLHATETVDVIGKVGGPVGEEGFRISTDGDAFEIGAGRYYVEGILCESRQPVQYMDQAFLIDPHPTDAELLQDLTAGTITVIQLYLEVWRRLVIALDDPCLREPALGQADTTARLQTVWRVVAKGLNVPAPASAAATFTAADNVTGVATAARPEGNCCKSMRTGLIPVIDPGKLGAKTADTDDCGCDPIPAAGYRGLENQLYRVEIHHTGNESDATFKWSRENGSVVVAVTDVSGRQVYVDGVGPDANLGFVNGQWVEISDDSDLFGDIPNQPGILYQIQNVDAATLTVTMTQPVAWVDSTKNARMRRWDQSSAAAGGNGISLIPGPIVLENGIEIEFTKGNYRSGDYWLIPARTATGAIEWPPCESDGDRFQPAERSNLFVAPLACVTWDSQTGRAFVQDCRKKFYPLTDLTPTQATTCCTYRVGDGVTSFGDFKSIQAAVHALPPEGGEVCILPGFYSENVHIINRRDVVIHGCGWQTRVTSGPSVSAAPPAASAAGSTVAALNPFGAVFTIVASEHIQLRSFVIEAADNDVGILLDGTETSLSGDQVTALALVPVRLRGVVDVTIEAMVVTASSLPAILAMHVELLRIDRNRVVMKNVRSVWSAIYASGKEIHIDRNWIGIRSTAAEEEWLPSIVTEDLGATTSGSTLSQSALNLSESTINRTFINSAGIVSVKLALFPGAIQIGGPSTDVYILENEIEGGSRNGITLGSFDLLDANGGATGIWTGVVPTGEDDNCDCNPTLQLPGTQPGGTGNGFGLVAGGLLTDIQIHRNRIRNLGLCGIGPVGFFETTEVITIIGLNISSNAIVRTLLRDTVVNPPTSLFGYGAICIPDVADLIVCDNTITDFGAAPGVSVCGIFVLHGEMLEISRNQVIENRDWTQVVKDAVPAEKLVRGGIVILAATPPVFAKPIDGSAWSATFEAAAIPVYEQGLPAVRVENNVVRVPVSFGLFIIGVGPFAILNNHFSCGGLVPVEGRAIAQTVLILNFGTAIESAAAAVTPSGVYEYTNNAATGISAARSRNVSSGAVLFSNNMCQLEASVSRQNEAASVFIFTPDHLIFNNNHCWLDTSRISALADALLLAGSLNVVGNRFQEAPLSVLFSALTAGVVNITGENISTFCVLVLGPLRRNNNNLSILADLKLCAALETAFLALFG